MKFVGFMLEDHVTNKYNPEYIGNLYIPTNQNRV